MEKQYGKGDGHVTIPKQLWKTLDDLIFNNKNFSKFGWRSKAEFCVSAIRDKVERLTGEPSI